MTELLRTDRSRELVIELRRLAAERVATEEEVVAAYEAKKLAAKRQYEEAQKQVAERHERDREDLEADYQKLRGEVVGRFQSDQMSAEGEYEQAVQQITRENNNAEQAGKQRLQDAQWQANAVFEAAKNSLDSRLKEAHTQLAAQDVEIRTLRQQAEQLLSQRKSRVAPPRLPPLPPSPTAHPVQRLFELMALAKAQLQSLANQRKPGMLRSALSRLRGTAQQVDLTGPMLLETISAAELAWRAAGEAVQADWHRQSAAILAQLNVELKKAADEFARTSSEWLARRLEELKQAEAKFVAAGSAISARHNTERRELEDQHQQRLAEIDARYETESGGLLRGYTRTTAEWDARFQQDWDAMAKRWLTGVERLQTVAGQLMAASQCSFPDWTAAAWSEWTPATTIPSSLPFGRLDFDLGDVENGVSQDPRLMPPGTVFSFPMVFPFRDRSLLLMKAGGEGRVQAIAAMQAMMLRLLTSFPPGKVRFLIVDPVGLGENFSAFMHLADFNDQLVSSRIWTESGHIERRLGELTEHMENVIQVYLRNEYQAIQDYNESAGELAEPYRILVVANFPANFSETAARRLLSIVSSGARCGVFSLLILDTGLQLPREFQLPYLERYAVKLTWRNGQFVWDDPDLAGTRQVLAGPPTAEQFTDLVRRVGHEARDAGRIELPFKLIAPARDEWWTADSRQGVDVPVGRAGVTKFQNLQLGKGTSQHVLLSGKTGSGKSTLLHVLILNLALRYSPDEIELYLIDFKKGVEFKAYAEAAVPHARVIAIESEREFGLSVLERLDLELKQRGDLFRQRGVQDLPGFRAAEPDRKMPRILLIVDEFQELFVEDDRIAQTASLFLDRLVRQGRAFGIHVLLGSQTLGGSYSIPRSTIGQMAVRIALQCSEADAHLILSEENTAARLLNRPGEAIYNDANGLYEGNHPFQVVWLSDHEREEYLTQLNEWAGPRLNAYGPAIVFEGNQPADPAKNSRLCEMLQSPSWTEPNFVAKAWLGAPVAIKEPTAATFARQSGAHLLLVGHQEDSALGTLAAALVSLAAQHAPTDPRDGQPGVRFYVLDGLRPDAPQAGFWNQLAAVLPHSLKIASPRKAPEVIAEIAEELARREASDQEDAPPIYLVIYDVARFRDLRKSDDDFGFSRSDEDAPPNPGRQFRAILHDGPAVGVHALIWADGYNSVVRSIDRQGLDDIEMRVLFRMNAADSSNLIDSAAASQLGVHRAIFDDEGQGLVEKFRPYGLPTGAWLEWVKSQFQGRVE